MNVLWQGPMKEVHKMIFKYIFFSPDAFMTVISVLVPILQIFSALKSLKDT